LDILEPVAEIAEVGEEGELVEVNTIKPVGQENSRDVKSWRNYGWSI
jgi:hypothetical protein